MNTTETFNFLQKLQQSVYEGNKQRGFWEAGVDENKGERVMLIITELAEVVEAHRKGNTISVYYPTWVNVLDVLDDHIEVTPNFWKVVFVSQVKDTLQDEIADVVIRILDYTGGFNIEIRESTYCKESTGNFAHDVLQLTHYCMAAYHSDIKEFTGKDWNYVLAAIIRFCEWYNINLIQHITWKLHYNSTRPYKHGKKY
jgi:hypothetical protein